jgi:CubicO group peptidase (beta-lactamase class C family)
MQKRRLVIFFLIAIFTNGKSFPQITPDSLSDKVDLLFTELNNNGSPGAAVLVVKDGKIILRRGYGMANLEYKIAVKPSTVFDIASLSKQFTGMAISMLIEEGKIALQDDIRKYIPEMPDSGCKITIDNLIHHTSGLRDWPGTLALAGWQMDDVISFEQIMNMTFSQQDLNFMPGSEYTYCNTGYNILAELVHRVSGKSFREWMNINIFQPLGMLNTHFQDDYTEIIPDRAYSYNKSDGKFHAVNNGLTAYGSSSLYTTIDDLAKWVINLDNPKVGGISVVNRMFQQGMLNNGSQISYAFGVETGKYRGIKEISHSGSWASFSTFLAYFPEQHISIVILRNSEANTYRDAHNIADIYLGERLEKPIKVKSTKNSIIDSVNVPITVLDDYVGKYRLGIAWYVTITRNGACLMTYATGEKNVPMTALSSATFWIKDYRDSIKFNRDSSGRVIGFYYHGMNCPKLEDLPPPNQLDEFAGEYLSNELKTIYLIVVEDGHLVISHRKTGAINLVHVWKDIFLGNAWYMKSVEFYRDDKGRICGFMVSGNRSRNQRFIKLDPKEKNL